MMAFNLIDYSGRRMQLVLSSIYHLGESFWDKSFCGQCFHRENIIMNKWIE